MNGPVRVMETALFIRNEIQTVKRMSWPAPREALQLNLGFTLENGEWTGECSELGIATSHETSIELAREALKGLILMHLEGKQKLGQLEEALEGREIARYALGGWPTDEGGSFTAPELQLT